MNLEKLALFLFLKNFVEKMSTENTELLEINRRIRSSRPNKLKIDCW